MKTNRLFNAAFAIVTFALCAMSANAQAILPTSWSFDVAAPAGWSESLGSGNTRYVNGFIGSACRLDNTGEFVLLEFVEEPGVVTYNMKAQNTSGAFSGSFTIQESANGTDWTTLRSLVDAALPSAAFTPFSDTPQPTTRYIRWFFTNKVSGNNVALDEISLALPVAGAEQEINITSGGNNVPSTTTLFIGNTTTTVITIENLGNDGVLEVPTLAVDGPHADQFTISPFDNGNSIDPGSSTSFDLTFTPVGTGSRFCTLTFENNDSNENPYIINVYAIAGTAANEPSAAAGTLGFSNITSWDFNVNVTQGTSDAERFVVLRKKGAPVTEAPSDNTTYVKGQWIGGAQVVYVGQAGSFNARNIEASTAYHFAVFPANGPAGFENYLTDNPTTAIATSLNPNIGSYYAGLNHNDPNFVGQLTARLEPSNYFQVFYSNYISTLINEFYVRDTVTAAGVSASAVECQYSGDVQIYEAGFQFWTGTGPAIISREHAFPQSWMPTFLLSNFEDRPEYSDLHNLFPVNQVECNAVRSNYPYGEVVTPTDVYGDCQLGNNSFNQTVYEPRASIKGDVARAMMYQAVKNNAPGEDFSFPEQINPITVPYGQMDYVIKQWHFEDLPDNYEIARNEYIQTRQNNRNGFIDSLDFPCYIRFSNLTKFVPQFVNTLGTLNCTDMAMSYQWLVNGEEIAGATSSSFVPTEAGLYSVRVQQFEECPVFESAATEVTVSVNENNLAGWNLEVFPNPSNGTFNVAIEAATSEIVDVVVSNAAGARVSLGKQTLVQGRNVITTNQNLDAGMYFVEVIASNGKLVKSIIIE
jgi:endonuclease I